MECRLCGNKQLEYYYAQGNSDQFKYYRCPECSLVNLDLNNKAIYENQEKYEDSFPDPNIKPENPGSVQSHQYIKEKLNQKGKMLDIGCGNGALLLYCREDGWNVQGLELSEKLAGRIKNDLNIDVRVANFMELEEIEPEYDLVVLRHVLEHIPEPITAMTNINRFLKPGGHAVLEFPNIEGISFKFRRLLEKLGVYKKKYPAGYVPGHANEFSRKSFQILAEKTGFELLEWQTYSLNEFRNSIYKVFNVSTKARVLIKKNS